MADFVHGAVVTLSQLVKGINFVKTYAEASSTGEDNARPVYGRFALEFQRASFRVDEFGVLVHLALLFGFLLLLSAICALVTVRLRCTLHRG